MKNYKIKSSLGKDGNGILIKKSFFNQDDEFMQKLYAEIAQAQKEEKEHNENILNRYKVPNDSFELLLDCCNLSGKIEVVNESKGDFQEDEGDDFFLKIYVDQWATGMEGDSFSGFIYGLMENGMYLKVPFDC